MTSEDIPVPAPANPSPKSAARVKVVIDSLLLQGLAESNLLSISSPEWYAILGINCTNMQKPSFGVKDLGVYTGSEATGTGPPCIFGGEGPFLID